MCVCVSCAQCFCNCALLVCWCTLSVLSVLSVFSALSVLRSLVCLVCECVYTSMCANPYTLRDAIDTRMGRHEVVL